MQELTKGSRTTLPGTRYAVRLESAASRTDVLDVLALVLGADRRVRGDDDLVFFNNPRRPGVELTSDGAAVDLAALPAEVDRVVVAASTEVQGATFAAVGDLAVVVEGEGTALRFAPTGLGPETVLQAVAFYRRAGQWKLEAIGQGYDRGLAAFAVDHGLDVAEPELEPGPAEAAPPAARPVVDAPAPIDLRKVSVTLTKDSQDRTARIDLRKNQGEAGWVLTVGLEWDGRGAKCDASGAVTKYGTGDLDVYFFCRDEETDRYVVVSGERGHRGSLESWPFVEHAGDSTGPGKGGRPAVEEVRVLPQENGDLLVNVYQSVDNGLGSLDSFGRPRLVVRYGRADRRGRLGPDADEIVVRPGNSRNSFWASVARIDVQDGVLTVDGTTRYSKVFTERMPGLSATGAFVREPKDGPVGRSKRRKGTGLDRYEGRCPS